MSARTYMSDRGLDDFRRCFQVGRNIVTNEEPEDSELIFRCIGGKLEAVRWTPPPASCGKAECWMVWTLGTTPEPLCRCWTIETYDPVTLAKRYGWSAEEYPDFPEDFQFCDGKAAAMSLAVQAALKRMEETL